MQIIFDSKDKTVMRIDKGEEFFAVLYAFAKERDKSFTFSAIGGCDLAEIACFDTDLKEYATKKFTDKHIEIINMTGNMAWYGSEPLIHMHGVFAGKDYECFGGHVMQVHISATAEVAISWLTEKMERKFDEDTCLKLLSI